MDGEASQNHHMFGTVTDWFFKYIAGIQPDEDTPGFKHIKITPNFEGIDFLKFTYRDIKIEWSTVRNEINLKISIPNGCYATLKLKNREPIFVKDNVEISNIILTE